MTDLLNILQQNTGVIPNSEDLRLAYEQHNKGFSSAEIGKTFLDKYRISKYVGHDWQVGQYLVDIADLLSEGEEERCLELDNYDIDGIDETDFPLIKSDILLKLQSFGISTESLKDIDNYSQLIQKLRELLAKGENFTLYCEY